MSTPTDDAIVQAMKTFGGSFVQALGELCDRADPVNLTTIKAAFPEIWNRYAELVKMRAARGEGLK